MSLIALLVEGLTERIFCERITPYIQTSGLLVSRNLVTILDNHLCENKIWLVDCFGDRSAPSYMKKNQSAFMRNDFDRLVLVRDYYPDNRLPSIKCKRDLSRSVYDNMPEDIKAKYRERIFINLSIVSVEAWFFIDHDIFSRMDALLTRDFVNRHFGNILERNPENILNPANTFEEIVRSVNPQFRYRKHEHELNSLISNIDMGTCLNKISNQYAYSLDRLVMNILLTLS